MCVCVPTYNAAATLAATLNSILSQTYANIKVFIVDNASTDDTLAIAALFAGKDPRVQVIPHSQNVGAEGNFSRCITYAGGEYTAIFHSDDIYSPYIIAEQVKFLQDNPQAGAVFAMADTFDSHGHSWHSYRLPSALAARGLRLYDFQTIFRAILKNGNFLLCPGAMVRTTIYKDQVRRWDEEHFHTSADLDVWLRILQKHSIGIINTPLFRYRVTPSSYSYEAGRVKTSPHDMLLVLEAYVSGCARDLMGPQERADYARLILNDNVNRAFNLAVTGKGPEARALLQGVFSADSLSAAVFNRYHLKTVLLAVPAAALAIIPLPSKVRQLVSALRFKSRG